MRLYMEAFPRWERESEGALRRRLASGRYWMRAGIDRHGDVVGFVTLDIEPPLEFGLLTYLVVAESMRGQGLGTALTHEAIRLFRQETNCRWLLIEAEDRQAELYGRIGFLKIDIGFDVPRIGDDGVVPMHLMVYPRDDAPSSMTAADLRRIIEWIYKSGYMLREDDPRVVRQLALIEDNVALIRWPQTD